jgi:hypothetical protein
MFGKKKPVVSLFDPDKIDVVATAPNGSVRLVVVQDQPWTGSDEELQSLRQKVHNYVAYAVDGQMHRDKPESQGHPWSIAVVSMAGAPDRRSAETLAQLQEAVPRHGGAFTHHVGLDGLVD